MNIMLSIVSCRNSVKRTVIFAEPVAGNTNKQLDADLLPGDRLLEVNGQNVQNTNREDIIDIIRNSGSTVTLKVRLFSTCSARYRVYKNKKEF